jgi:hypothetical protein
LVLVGLGVVYLIGWLAGRKLGQGDQTKYPKDPTTGKPQTIPRTWVEEVAPGILTALHSALEGLSIDVNAKNAALKKLLAIDDAQLVFVSNEYNHQYYAGQTTTLLKLIETEFMGWAGLGDEGPKTQGAVLARMRSLNIR